MFTAQSGYDRNPNSPAARFRYMTIAEAKALKYGDHVKFLDRSYRWRNAKVNGAPKTWKRDQWRVEVPLKYGMYEFFTAKTDSEKIDGFPWRMDCLIVGVD